MKLTDWDAWWWMILEERALKEYLLLEVVRQQSKT